MGLEIERKYLVKNDSWRGLGTPVSLRQGYLCLDPKRVVRVRAAGNKGTITIKGKTQSLARTEFNIPISREDADAMLDSLALRPLIEKNRTCIPFAGHIIEVDEFFGENAGLIVAEIELESETEHVDLPEWIGQEVTGDPRYLNANLIRNPYSAWKQRG